MLSLCVCVCFVTEAAGGGGGEARDTESKTRTPHKDVGNKKGSERRAGKVQLVVKQRHLRFLGNATCEVNCCKGTR